MSGFLGGGLFLPYAQTSVNYSLTDDNYALVCLLDGLTVTLPPANAHNLGRIFAVKSADTGIAVQVNASGTETIDGNMGGIGLSDGQSYMFQANGNGGWIVISIH